MSDRAGFFAVCADCLTEMCLYYEAARILLIGSGWGVHLGWLLLWTVLSCAVFALTLRKPRTVPALTALTCALILAGGALFVLVSVTPLRFGYCLVLAVGAGMAVGVPLRYTLHRPKILSHLTELDLLIGGLFVLLLTKDALGIDGWTVALTTAVVFMDAAAAVGLRMAEGGGAESGSTLKASMVALVSALLLALLVALASLLFSRSGAVTGGLLHGLGAFFAAVGRGIERIIAWLAGRFTRQDEFEAPEPEGYLPSLAESEFAESGVQLSVDTTALGIVLCVLAAAAAVTIAVLLRRSRAARAVHTAAGGAEATVRRTGGTASVLWQKLRQALAFRWAAFLHRDTPAGLLVLLERMGKRAKAPRRTGETMRAFLMRMDPAGGLSELADALDRQFYGGGGQMTPRRCRETRRYIRRTLRRAGRGAALS